MTPEAINRQTTIPIEIIREGIAALEQPDPDSRRPDYEGRRIVRLDPQRSWGWQIVNYTHYRQIRSAEDRRDYQRLYMQEWRQGKRRTRPAKGNGEDKAAAPELPDWIPAELFASWWQAKPKRARTSKARELGIAKLDELRAAGHEPTAVLEHCIRSGYQGIFPPKSANGSAAPPSAPRPSITCEDCGQRAYTWTGHKCDDCQRIYMSR